MCKRDLSFSFNKFTESTEKHYDVLRTGLIFVTNMIRKYSPESPHSTRGMRIGQNRKDEKMKETKKCVAGFIGRGERSKKNQIKRKREEKKKNEEELRRRLRGEKS